MKKAGNEIKIIKSFGELTVEELYEVLELRSKVFVVEQNCVYQDIDGVDRIARHVFIPGESGVLAYARVHPKADESGVFRLGRIVTDARGQGFGMAVLTAALSEAKRLGAKSAYIEAQEYAIGFYEKAGFAVTSGVFLEDGIPHVEMRLVL